MLYVIAPNVKQRFIAQIPGAAVAVVVAGEFFLGCDLYFSSFAQFTAIYGTLGAMIALMLWFYFSSLAVLIGAEVNAQIQLASSPDRTM
jgi:membrane protein